MTKHIHKIWPPVTAFVIGLAVMNFFKTAPVTHSSTTDDPTISLASAPTSSLIRRKSSQYSYINPLLFCDTSENKGLSQFKLLKDAAQQVIDTETVTGGVGTVSIYFRDLDPGYWFGINTDNLYAPASLFKVPTAIAAYKIAEQQPEFLLKKVLYTGTDDLNASEYFKPSVSMEKGRLYTIEELIEHMVEYSDNNALRLIQEQIDPDYLKEVLSDLGLSRPGYGDVNVMSVKEYSFAFRVLYNGTYLNHQFSNKLLQLLSQPDFPHGIRGGVPDGIVVAQKFGERTVNQFTHPGEGPKELHDCGIIYYPDHPYFLCIMTQGTDYDRLSATIQHLSKTIFEKIDGIYGPYSIPQEPATTL